MLKLNIYEKGKIKKTYQAEAADIMYGTLEDITSIINIDKLADFNDKTTQIELGKMVFKVIPLLCPLLQGIFPELTKEELRNVKTTELIKLVMELVQYGISEIASIGDSSGN